MRGLFKYLPPFSSDIPGACSALFGLKGIVVVHEPACCTSSYTRFDEPRYYGSNSALYSSELREIHISTGDDETLLRRIEAAVSMVDPSFIAIIGTPIPMFAGTDYRALASVAEKRTGITSFAVETGGFDSYQEGIGKACLELAKRFVPSPEKTRKLRGGVNILGITPLDTVVSAGMDEMRKTLEAAGYTLISTWTEGSSLDEMRRAGEAEVNIVPTLSGLSTAKYFKKEYGIPYLVDFPVGEAAVKRFLRKLEVVREAPDAACSGGIEGDDGKTGGEEATGEKATGDKVLVLGEQVLANSVRDCFREEFSLADTRVVSFFGMRKKFMRSGDIELSGEDEYFTLLREGNFNIIIGDDVFSRFLGTSRDVQFIALPHIAVSGFTPGREIPNILGKKGAEYFRELGITG